MNYYLLLLLLIIVTYIIIQKIVKLKNKEKIFLTIAFIEMLLFLGLRDITIGTDLKNYIPYFNFFKNTTWNGIFLLDLERGYIILNKIISLFGGENFFLFIVAIICLAGVYISIKQYSQNYFFSIFIYITMQFYIFLFSGLRQAIAFSIIWISLKYVIERKLFKFILFVLIASTFHKSAIICLPIYFIATKKITLKYFMFFMWTLIVAFVFKGEIVNLITRYVYSNYDLTKFSGRI